ncbi:MAG TPA: AbrB/MazE/SpoVT family DNA-binding domain-containing protein [Candidatus Nanoarchaeia archaeon]|nr:AbrB/MazE/SpoVT family DNA-binding domain-containing protein [Candidatus Nanoarchaeia archaeon]
MVELKVRLGPKGQVVIPKILREAYGLYSRQEVIITEKDEGVLIKRNSEDILQTLKEIAKEITIKRNGKKLEFNSHSIEEQYEERARKAGIKV